MPRIPIATTVLVASLATLAACGQSQSSGSNVSMRDMEVVDGTANDAMTDLDNVTMEGTKLEGVGSGLANAGAVTNASAPASPSAPESKEPRKTDADAAE